MQLIIGVICHNILFQSQEVRKNYLKKNDCRDINSDQGQISRWKQHTSYAWLNPKCAIIHIKFNPALSIFML